MMPWQRISLWLHARNGWRQVARLKAKLSRAEAERDRFREGMDLAHGRLERLRRFDGNAVREIEAVEGMLAWYLGRPGPFGDPRKKKSEGEG